MNPQSGYQSELHYKPVPDYRIMSLHVIDKVTCWSFQRKPPKFKGKFSHVVSDENQGDHRVHFLSKNVS